MLAQAQRQLGALPVGGEELPRLTVETCPHYLTFASEEIPDGETRRAVTHEKEPVSE